jgi:hypothetical protein
MAALVQSAWAVRERGSIFRKRFYRQMMHRGKKRAVIAAARALLAVVWQVLQKGVPYAEPTNELFQQREHSKKVRHRLRKLKELGVDISPLELPPLPDLPKPTTSFHPFLRSAWYPCSVKHYFTCERSNPPSTGPPGRHFRGNDMPIKTNLIVIPNGAK